MILVIGFSAINSIFLFYNRSFNVSLFHAINIFNFAIYFIRLQFVFLRMPIRIYTIRFDHQWRLANNFFFVFATMNFTWCHNKFHHSRHIASAHIQFHFPIANEYHCKSITLIEIIMIIHFICKYPVNIHSEKIKCICYFYYSFEIYICV